MDEQAHYRWIASHILPLEAQARRWLSRHVRSLSRHDIDDLIQEAYSRIWTADPETIARPRAYLFATLRNLILEQARHAQIIPMERMGKSMSCASLVMSRALNGVSRPARSSSASSG